MAASASREQIVYALDTTKATIPEAVELLADAVLNPRFAPWEVKAAAEKLEADLKQLENNPQATLLEVRRLLAPQGSQACLCKLLDRGRMGSPVICCVAMCRVAFDS